MKTLKILIADGHKMVAEGLKLLIESRNKSYKVRVTLPDRLFIEVEKNVPDLVLFEISSASGGGISILKNLKVRFPKTKVLVLTAYKPTWHAKHVFASGACGYLMKNEPPDVLLEVIEKVSSGEIYVTADILKKAMSDWAGGQSDDTCAISKLSPREFEVFEWVGRGASTAKIAETLHMAGKTVQAHREHITKKLGFKHGSELLVHAVQWVQSL